jgi:hypothetical protein
MTPQAFLEAPGHAFAYFGGVCRRRRHDNRPEAVKRIVRGFRRAEPARFVAFRSHRRFAAAFGAPGEAPEEGGGEGEVGRFRRDHRVPVPAAPALAALTARLLAEGQAAEARRVDGQTPTVGAALLVERAHLPPVASEPCDLIAGSFPTVDRGGCVKVTTDASSAPAKAGPRVEVELAASAVTIWHAGRGVAEHERSDGRPQELLDLEHSLAVLARRPGALAGRKPLARWRRAGRWPASYDRFRQGLIERPGRAAGTKAMIELPLLGRRHGHPALRAAIAAALALGCTDSAAVRHLLTVKDLERPPSPPLDVGDLGQFERPVPSVGESDPLRVAAQPAGRVAR